jgi:hypothetical protein
VGINSLREFIVGGFAAGKNSFFDRHLAGAIMALPMNATEQPIVGAGFIPAWNSHSAMKNCQQR